MFGPISCKDPAEPVGLTHHIYPPDQFDALIPMGRMWDSHVTPTDHLYVRLNEARPRTVVTSPADGQIISISRFPNDQSPHWDSSIVEPDYRMVIAHSCSLFSVFIHLGELAPEITAVTGDLALGERWSASNAAPLPVRAGDSLASMGGSSFDYSLHDEKVILRGFQVPEHYEGEPWKVHTVDPFDYMTPDMAAELLPKNERQAEPVGGRIDYDVPGTLAGNWFMDGTVDYRGGDSSGPEYWTGHLAIAYDHIDPSQIRVSIGRDIGLTWDDCRSCGGVYAVNGNGPDPASVTSSDGPVKYELTGRRHVSPDSNERTVGDGVVLGTFLVEVLDDASIRTEFFKDVGAANVAGFTSTAIIYRR